jgi:nitrogen fixation protein NifU and related proteins
MDDLYRQLIVERHKNPLHRGELEVVDFEFEDENPFCGDHLHVMVHVDENDIITDAKFDGTGCAISTASADILMEYVIGKHIDEVKAIEKEELLDLMGIEFGPVRLKCALLSLKVLKGAVYGLEETES